MTFSNFLSETLKLLRKWTQNNITTYLTPTINVHVNLPRADTNIHATREAKMLKGNKCKRREFECGSKTPLRTKALISCYVTNHSKNFRNIITNNNRAIALPICMVLYTRLHIKWQKIYVSKMDAAELKNQHNLIKTLSTEYKREANVAALYITTTASVNA